MWWWGVILGYIIGVSTFSIGGRYVAMFLMASGYCGASLPPPRHQLQSGILTRAAGFALTAVWVSNAVPRPPAKRAAAIALVNGFGNLGNLCVVPPIYSSCVLHKLTGSVCPFVGSARLCGRPSGAQTTIRRWRSESPRLGSRPCYRSVCLISSHPSRVHGFDAYTVIRWMLVQQNKRLDQEEIGDLKGARRERIEEAARLEGITFDEALRRRRGFRYLY